MSIWVTPVATLLASFSGAILAFLLQGWRRRREHDAMHIAAINRALMMMLLHGRIISNYKEREAQDYSEDDQYRAIRIEASFEFDLHQYSYDYSSLDFLTTIDERGVVLELYEEDDLFSGVLYSINDRSKLIYNEVDPALYKAGLADGEGRDGAELVRALGPQLFGALERKTDEVMDAITHELETLNQTIDSFTKVAAERYPRAAIMRIDLPENA